MKFEKVDVLVSIPERVLEALKPSFKKKRQSDWWIGFNPWKGFRGFEAEGYEFSQGRGDAFQSLKGF